MSCNVSSSEIIMSRALIESSAFFKQMEEFGFFDTVEEHLPDEFTMIYEIARILDSTEHGIAQALAPVMVLSGSNDRDHSLDLHPIPQVADAEEYEADLIRSVTELQRIYPYQHLLPEPVFLQRVAERSLWMPRPRVPKNYRYQSDSDRFAPDDRKQKVYVLFDTSSSMRQHYRIHLARAITYLFLQRNQRELGTIFFRTFDLTVGELRSARDVPGYDQLISDVMHVRALGNGTALQRALEQAIDDISHESMLSDTQILVITDGVAHVDVDALRARMGSSITVNTVKIGHSRMHVDAKIIEDQVYHSSSEDAMRLRALLDQRHQLESSLRVASGNMRTESIKSQLGLVERQISS
ncbi:MAG: vWA domain-containing protein, partial [Candidatus Nanopelagicaceae bacterium]